MRRKGVQIASGQKNEQKHPPSQTQIEVAKAKASTKRKAEMTEQTRQQILASELRSVSEGAAANLPSIDALKRNIQDAIKFSDMW